MDDLCVWVGPVWARDFLPRSSRVVSFCCFVSIDIFPIVARGCQAHAHVYYQSSSRGNLAHILSIVFIPNHHEPSSSLFVTLCVCVFLQEGYPGWDSTGLWASLDAGLPVDDNPRRDENETSIVSLRTTDANPPASALPLCVCACVPRATRSSLPPIPPSKHALSAQPPGSWVSLGHMGGGGGKGSVRKMWWEFLAGVTQQDYGSSDAGARLDGSTRSSQVFGVACCLPACLLACLPALPCLACPTYPPVLSPLPRGLMLTRSRGILASLLVAGQRGKGEKGGRSGPGKFTTTAGSGVCPPGGLKLVKQVTGVCHTRWCLSVVPEDGLLVPCVAVNVCIITSPLSVCGG